MSGVLIQLQQLTYKSSGERLSEVVVELYLVRYRLTSADDDADIATVVTDAANSYNDQTSDQQRLVVYGAFTKWYKCKKFELMLTGRAKVYSSSCPQAVTHRSTNRARRRVTSFQPKRFTNDATPPPWRRLVNDFVSQSEIVRKIHKNPYFGVQGHPRSLNFAPVYDLLLVINSNLGLISHRYWDTASYRPKIANFDQPPSHLATSFGVTLFEFMKKLYGSWN